MTTIHTINFMLKKIILLNIILVLTTFSFIYFSHSYGPHDQYPDSKHYYNMVKNPLDLDAAPAPFVYRQFTTYLTHLAITVAVKPEGEIKDKTIYSYLFYVNLVGVFLTMNLIMYHMISRLKINDLMTLIFVPILFFLSYKVMHQGIGNLCEGWVYFFIALCYHFFEKNNLLLLGITLVFSLLVKETVLLASFLFFASLIFISILKREKISKKIFFASVVSLLFFLIYFFLRKYGTIAQGFENQTTLSAYPVNFISFFMNTNLASYSKLIIHQNTLIILSVLLLYKYRLKPFVYSKSVIACFLSILAMFVICVCNGLSYNDVSRILSSFLPIYLLVFSKKLFVEK